MQNVQEIFIEKITRIKKAVALEKTDRIPTMIMLDAFCCKHVGASMARFSSDMFYQGEVIASSLKQFPDLDASEHAIVLPDMMGAGFLMKMKIAGRELRDDQVWQLDERERMTQQDYDTILEKGFNPFYFQYTAERLGQDLGQLLQTSAMGGGAACQKYAEIGLPVFTDVAPAQNPIEILNGGRSMPKLMRDLYKIPDKVQAVMDIIVEEGIQATKGMLAAVPVKPMSLFLGCARGAGEFVSPKISERFVYPYIKKIAEAILEEGITVNFHCDSNWERDLEFFKIFPKGTCVFACDHATDIYKVKEVLGDRMCIKGDVPAALLALGTPDEVYNYCTKLINDMGNGFILAPGCTLPTITKVENLEAMIAAATGK